MRLAAAKPCLPMSRLTVTAGFIVMTASIAAYDGQVGQAAYALPRVASFPSPFSAARDLAGQFSSGVMTIAPGTSPRRCWPGSADEVTAALGGAGSASLTPGPAPRVPPPLAAHIVDNAMLNGEVIRLDGALRMPPR